MAAPEYIYVNSPSSNPELGGEPELIRKMSEFVGAFEVVFRYDWEYSKAMIGDEEDGCNFIEPGLDDEVDNWGARSALLESYRVLVAAMIDRGIKPEFPFPLERIQNCAKRIW